MQSESRLKFSFVKYTRNLSHHIIKIILICNPNLVALTHVAIYFVLVNDLLCKQSHLWILESIVIIFSKPPHNITYSRAIPSGLCSDNIRLCKEEACKTLIIFHKVVTISAVHVFGIKKLAKIFDVNIPVKSRCNVARQRIHKLLFF